MNMRLSSSAFAQGAYVPVHFTCDGANASPPLAWIDPPAGTKSFALVCADPDAPGGVWYHWAIYDIPAATHALAEAWPPARTSPPQAINDFRRTGYGGPCPPRGNAPHHYHFRLYALDVANLQLGANVHCRAVEAAARAHAMATADHIGLYGRK
jgi:Raf kinase inhibitor-like YbhB/YbcL family protein